MYFYDCHVELSSDRKTMNTRSCSQRAEDNLGSFVKLKLEAEMLPCSPPSHSSSPLLPPPPVLLAVEVERGMFCFK